MGKSVSLSSNTTTAATSSGLSPGRVWSRSIPPCSRSLFPSVPTSVARIWGADLPMREGPGASGLEGVPVRPHRPSSVLEEAGFLGTSGLPRRQILLMSPDSIGNVRVGAMSSTLRIRKSKS